MPADVAAYLDKVDPAGRAALENLRAQILAAAPSASERIGYGIPMYSHDGPLVSFGAFTNHLTFFVQSGAVMEAHAAKLAGRTHTKGGVHFTADKPLAAALVKKIVKARLAENAATVAAREARKAAKKSAAKAARTSPSVTKTK